MARAVIIEHRFEPPITGPCTVLPWGGKLGVYRGHPEQTLSEVYELGADGVYRITEDNRVTRETEPCYTSGMTQSTDTAQDRIIVITFGMVGEDGAWVPSHLTGLPGGGPIALNAGYELGHVVHYLATHGWAVVSPFTFRSKHHTAAWVRPISTRTAPPLGEGPELAWTRPADLDTSDRHQVDSHEILEARS